MRTVTERWYISWFPPDAPEKKQGFPSEARALAFAAREDIARWSPFMEHHRTTTEVTLTQLAKGL